MVRTFISRTAVLVLFIGFSVFSQTTFAHGTHIWFVLPEQDASLQNNVMLVVEAPYAKNRYIHLRVTKEGEDKPTWEGLITLADKKYSTQIDIKEWSKGKYKAEVVLMGGLVQHPVRRDFVVK